MNGVGVKAKLGVLKKSMSKKREQVDMVVTDGRFLGQTCVAPARISSYSPCFVLKLVNIR